MLYPQNSILDLLSIDDRFIKHSSVLIGSNDFLVDFQWDGSVVEYEVFGHDGESAIETDELELFGLLDFVDVGALLAIDGLVDFDL